MTLDVIICTYNRPVRVIQLVKQLQQCSPLPNRIIVVDSSDEENPDLKYEGLVHYIRANHKNQPYQRFCGWNSSEADLLLYLDDDMEVVKLNFLDIVQQHFTSYPHHVGMALNFEDKHKVASSLSEIPQSVLMKKGSLLKRCWNIFSGQPSYEAGKLGWCGMRGKQPDNGGYTEWISGGAFAARRNQLFQNFNFQIFDLFEQKKGMGEDAMIGYTLSKYGKLYYLPELLFYHDDDSKSHYSGDVKGYAHRVMYSRLFLSMEKARLNSQSHWLARAHYIWYGICRILGYFFNAILHPGTKRYQILLGSLSGYIEAFGMRRWDMASRKQYWLQEQGKMKA